LVNLCSKLILKIPAHHAAQLGRRAPGAREIQETLLAFNGGADICLAKAEEPYPIPEWNSGKY
jgi:hypothetical protein